MKKCNGFVFVETIIVCAVLSTTLLMLYQSYSGILRKARERETYDTTAYIYKTFFTKKALTLRYKTSKDISFAKKYVTNVDEKSKESVNNCFALIDDTFYECDVDSVYDSNYSNNDLYTFIDTFEIDKIYYIENPSSLFENISKGKYIDGLEKQLDATSLDYLKTLRYYDGNYYVVKYKVETVIGNNTRAEETVYFSSLEVS